MATVFVSYSHVDSGVADEIGGILSSQGIDFFRDIKDIEWGVSITSEVRLGLEEATAIIVIVSPASLKSHWVPFEVGYASALGKKILPYLTHPSHDVPSYIRDLKYLTQVDQVRDYFSSEFHREVRDSEPLPDVPDNDTETERSAHVAQKDQKEVGVLVILSAKYGTEGASPDVTEFVRPKVAAGKLEMLVTNDNLGGDPVPNVRKALEVVYSYAGETHTKTVREGEMLSLP